MSDKTLKILAVFFLFSIYICRWLPFLINAQIEAGLEDGFVFMSSAHNNGYLSLVEPYQGYLHTFLRLWALVAVHAVPIDFTPYLFQLFAFGFSFFPVLFMFSSRTDVVFGNSLINKFGCGLLYVLLPACNETLGSLTNLQWYLPFWVWMWLLSTPSKHRTIKAAESILFVLVCLTGPFVIFYLPIWLLAIYFKKTPKNIFYTTVIVLSACIQMFFIVTYSETISVNEDKQFELTNLLSGLSNRLFWNGIVGFYSVKFYIPLITKIFFWLPALAVWAWVLWRSYKSSNNFIMALQLLGIMIFCAGILKNKWIEPENLAGTRYFIISIYAFLVTLYFDLQWATHRAIKLTCMFLLAAHLVIAVPLDFENKRMKKWYWHRNLIEHYYTAKPGEYVRLENASMTILRKPSPITGLTGWQKFLLKKEALWALNEEQSANISLPSFQEQSYIDIENISLGDYVECTVSISEKQNFGNLYLVLEDSVKSTSYVFRAIPFRENDTMKYYFGFSIRNLKRKCEFKISIFEAGKSRVATQHRISTRD